MGYCLSDQKKDSHYNEIEDKEISITWVTACKDERRVDQNKLRIGLREWTRDQRTHFIRAQIIFASSLSIFVL
jgi:hypothetical protein